MSNASQENKDKVAYFQDVTGVDDAVLSTQILEANAWDLDAAVSSVVGGGDEMATANNRNSSSSAPPVRIEEARSDSVPSDRHPTSGFDAAGFPSSREQEDPESFGAGHQNSESSASLRRPRSGFERFPSSYDNYEDEDDDSRRVRHAQPGIVWRVVALPFSIVRGSYNLIYGAVGLGMWIASGMISYSLGALGFLAAGDGAQASRALLPVSSGAAEATLFVRNFEREYGEDHPTFQTLSFIDALRRAGQQYRFLFVYLHSPNHANTPDFCEKTLCSEAVVHFLNENFVVWGGDVRTSEGFQMSTTLKASTFPFCAVATASSNQRIALLQQVEGLKTADELIAILQRVVDEQGSALMADRLEEEERQLNRRLRQEQDAAYQAALQADQERERKQREEAERAAKEAEEVERRRLDEVESFARAEREAADRALSMERRRQEKAASLGVEPEKGSNVTQVLVRLPSGERKDRRFYSHEVLQKVYDYVDSLGSLNTASYRLVSNFPRTVYGPEKLGLTLQAAGLHPNASLFVQVDDN